MPGWVGWGGGGRFRVSGGWGVGGPVLDLVLELEFELEFEFPDPADRLDVATFIRGFIKFQYFRKIERLKDLLRYLDQKIERLKD